MFITNDYLQCKFYTLLCCFEIFFKDINGVFFRFSTWEVVERRCKVDFASFQPSLSLIVCLEQGAVSHPWTDFHPTLLPPRIRFSKYQTLDSLIDIPYKMSFWLNLTCCCCCCWLPAARKLGSANFFPVSVSMSLSKRPHCKPLTKIAKLPFLQEGLICQVALVGEVGRSVG